MNGLNAEFNPPEDAIYADATAIVKSECEAFRRHDRIGSCCNCKEQMDLLDNATKASSDVRIIRAPKPHGRKHQAAPLSML